MLWVQGFNKHIVQDMEGEYIATFKDADEAEAQVRLHNTAECIEYDAADSLRYMLNSRAVDFKLMAERNAASESIDTRLASSNGWTNHLPTGGRK